MGKAIIIPNVDFSNSGMGKVTIPSPPVTELTAISIVAPQSSRYYTGGPNDTFQFSVDYTPSNTTSTGVNWQIQTGSTSASITLEGVLTILPHDGDKLVMIEAVSTYDLTISATYSLHATYQENN